MAVNLNVPHGTRFETDPSGSRRWSRGSFEAAPSLHSSNAEDDEDELRQETMHVWWFVSAKAA